MKSLELKFLWELKNFAKANGGKLLSDDFLGRNHPYKWRCSRNHRFYAKYWDLKDKKDFCEKCKYLTNMNNNLSENKQTSSFYNLGQMTTGSSSLPYFYDRLTSLPFFLILNQYKVGDPGDIN